MTCKMGLMCQKYVKNFPFFLSGFLFQVQIEINHSRVELMKINTNALDVYGNDIKLLNHFIECKLSKSFLKKSKLENLQRHKMSFLFGLSKKQQKVFHSWFHMYA